MRLLLALLACSLLLGRAEAVQMRPMYEFTALGGQYFFKNERSKLSGNFGGLVSPAMKFNDRWALVPTLSASYKGTKQAVDLVNGSTLFQEQMDYRLGARAIHSVSGTRWRIKPSASFAYQLLRETTDESWGNGLFDYYKWSTGVEGEFVYMDPYSLRFGFDYFQTTFPNYKSLESEAQQKFEGQDLNRELVGERVLDTRNVTGFASLIGPVHKRLILRGEIRSTYTQYPDQYLVDGSGQLINKTRSDVLTSASVGARTPAELNPDLRILGSLDVTLAYNSSNQNNYDARNTRFFLYYYNYGEVKAEPSFKVFVGRRRKPVVWDVSGTYAFRRYPYRRAQDGSGNYRNTHLRQHNTTVSTSLTYPMAKHFSLLFNFQHGWAVSNQRFEQFYSYNYKVSNYLLGFKYEY